MGNATERFGIGSVGRRMFTDVGAGLAGVMAVCLAISVGAPRLNAADSDGKKPSRQTVAQGRVLFEREWQPGDSRTHGGDGLGPVYNDSSCVACHNQGGTGGAGSAGKNVDIITAAPNGQEQLQTQMVHMKQQRSFLSRALGSLLGLDAPAPAPAPNQTAAKPARRKVDTTELVKAHPGFRTSRSVVLHRFGTDENYQRWRQTFAGFQGANMMAQGSGAAEMMVTQISINFDALNTQTQIGPFFITRSQRNPTSLFGAGLIDSIAESDIDAAANVKYPGFPQIAGRVSRLKDKRIGRFGWKSQTASLSDFVLTACAVELGLEVPAHHQGGSPQQPDAKSKGLDLDAQECESLVAYVADLPRPGQRKPESEREANEVEAGRGLFAKVGCATCHSPKLGKVENIYSDLLLHDLGPVLGDVGQYGVFDPSSSEDEVVDDPATVADAPIPGVSPPPDRDFFPTTATAPVAAEGVSVAAAEVPPAAPQPPLAAAVVAQIPPPPDAPPRVIGDQLTAESPLLMTAQAFNTSTVSFGPGTPAVKRPASGPASRFEWRTPPLWGFRDSAPYLHDGRAKTLDQAIAFHGGEAASITQHYFKLTAKERQQLEAFMKTLTAPGNGDLVASAK